MTLEWRGVKESAEGGGGYGAVVLGAVGQARDWEGIQTGFTMTQAGVKGLLFSSLFMVPWSWN